MPTGKRKTVTNLFSYRKYDIALLKITRNICSLMSLFAQSFSFQTQNLLLKGLKRVDIARLYWVVEEMLVLFSSIPY